MKFNAETYILTEKGGLARAALLVAILGIMGSVYTYFGDHKQFYYSYLTAFVFWVSIGLGGLFFTMLHHLVDAKWSIVLRRLSESVMMTLPFMSILFAPIIFGMSDLFVWTNAEVVAHDHLLQVKSPYLNTTFFLIRTAFYFSVWGFLAFKLYRHSMNQDKAHSDSIFVKVRRLSASGMVLFAMTLTFASFDWLMSLDPHWYSTIFGAYIFAGTFLSILSFMVLMVGYQLRNGVLNNVVTVEHFHDMGKLIFAFVVFWAYMGFSQYFLIWYANLPEETYWFLNRWEGSWKNISLILVFGHFVIPFVALLTRAAKRNLTYLSVAAVYILCMRWIDLHWLVMPTLHPEGYDFALSDLTTMMAIGGMFVWLVWKRYTAGPLVPVGDPGLEQSIHHHS